MSISSSSTTCNEPLAPSALVGLLKSNFCKLMGISMFVVTEDVEEVVAVKVVELVVEFVDGEEEEEE